MIRPTTRRARPNEANVVSEGGPTDVAHLDLVDGLGAAEIEALFGGLETRTFVEGAQLDLSDGRFHCALVLRGRLALDYAGAIDRLRTVTLVEEGDLLFQKEPGNGAANAFAVRALRDSRLLLVTDDRFAGWLADPTLAARLVRQLTLQIADRELAAATALEPRVEHRLLMKLTQLADRFGRATPQGMRLDLRLTHQQLADMVGAVRESVTIAMGRLAANGDLTVDNRTIWIPYPGEDAAR